MKIKDLIVFLCFTVLLIWTVHLNNRISGVSLFNELAHDHIETAIEKLWNMPTTETVIYRGPRTVKNGIDMFLSGNEDCVLKNGDWLVLGWCHFESAWLELHRYVK